jgi:hypothetical protein
VQLRDGHAGVSETDQHAALSPTIVVPLEHVQSLPVQLDGALRVARRGTCHAEKVDTVGFAPFVPDLTLDRYGTLAQWDRAASLAELSEGVSQVAEGIALVLLIADCPGNPQSLGMELDRAVPLTQVAVRITHVSQRPGLQLAILECPCDGEALLLVAERAA